MENKPFNKPVVSNYIPSHIDEAQDWILGDSCSPAQVLKPDGQWVVEFPAGERQARNGFDSINCTNYSLLNCVETLGRFKYRSEFQNNLSERERGIRSGTQPTGNTIHNVCECLRTQGAVPEVFLPFDETIDSWAKYYSPNPISYSLWKVAESWKKKYQYNHDFVFLPGDPQTVKKAKMMEALKSSPLTVAGYAWSRHSDGLYYSDGNPNHAFDVVGYEEGKHWVVFDSYPDETGSFVKKLDWNFDFIEAKRHSLQKRVGGEGKEPGYLGYFKYLVRWYLNEIIK